MSTLISQSPSLHTCQSLYVVKAVAFSLFLECIYIHSYMSMLIIHLHFTYVKFCTNVQDFPQFFWHNHYLYHYYTFCLFVDIAQSGIFVSLCSSSILWVLACTPFKFWFSQNLFDSVPLDYLLVFHIKFHIISYLEFQKIGIDF